MWRGSSHDLSRVWRLVKQSPSLSTSTQTSTVLYGKDTYPVLYQILDLLGKASIDTLTRREHRNISCGGTVRERNRCRCRSCNIHLSRLRRRRAACFGAAQFQGIPEFHHRASNQRRTTAREQKVIFRKVAWSAHGPTSSMLLTTTRHEDAPLEEHFVAITIGCTTIFVV